MGRLLHKNSPLNRQSFVCWNPFTPFLHDEVWRCARISQNKNINWRLWKVYCFHKYFWDYLAFHFHYTTNVLWNSYGEGSLSLSFLLWIIELMEIAEVGIKKNDFTLKQNDGWSMWLRKHKKNKKAMILVWWRHWLHFFLFLQSSVFLSCLILYHIFFDHVCSSFNFTLACFRYF